MSCSKDEEEGSGSGSSNSSTSSSPSTSPGSDSGSGTSGESVPGSDAIVPDIRRGVNTQQYFINKEEYTEGNFIPKDKCIKSAGDSEGNHICAGDTGRRFTIPDNFSETELSSTTSIFVMKTDPSGDIQWVFNLNETFIRNVELGVYDETHFGEAISHTITFDDLGIVDMSVDSLNNIYVLINDKRSSITISSGAQDRGFTLIKITPTGNLSWIRQFDNQYAGDQVGSILYENGGSFYESNNLFEDNITTQILDTSIEFGVYPKGVEVTDNYVLVYGKTNISISAPAIDNNKSSGIIFGYSPLGTLLFIFQVPHGEAESGNYDETEILDIKYHPSSGHYFILGKVTDYDETGDERSTHFSVTRVDQNFKNSITNFALNSYISSKIVANGSNEAICKKLLLDTFGNAYCAGVTNLALAPSADKGVDDALETNTDDDIFIAKIHYLGYLEWLTQIDTNFVSTSDYVSDSTTNESVNDLIFDAQGNLLVLGSTNGSLGDLPSDDEDNKNSILFATVDKNGEILNVTQWGKDFFDDIPSKVEGNSIYLQDNKVYLGGASYNGRGYFCDNIESSDDIYTGFIANIDSWINSSSETKLITCPELP